jgi:hypothetical protein
MLEMDSRHAQAEHLISKSIRGFVLASEEIRFAGQSRQECSA